MSFFCKWDFCTFFREIDDKFTQKPSCASSPSLVLITFCLYRKNSLDKSVFPLYNIKACKMKIASKMRVWRNWQTRKI